MKIDRTPLYTAHNVCDVVQEVFCEKIGGVIVSNLFWRIIGGNSSVVDAVSAGYRKDELRELIWICDCLAEDGEQ